MEENRIAETDEARAEEIINRIRNSLEEIRTIIEQMKDRLNTQ